MIAASAMLEISIRSPILSTAPPMPITRMTEAIKSVTIVGGGTAGWMTAAILHHYLNQDGAAPSVDITLIESPNIPTVGVGEATVPGMPNLLQHLGVDEAAFFQSCHASFKLGVRFIDWSRDADGTPGDFVHPFNHPLDIHGLNPALHYQKFGPLKPGLSFGEIMCPNETVIRHLRAPRNPRDPDFRFVVGYAYHLDAALFARYLRERTIGLGVRHILDDLVEVEQDEAGFITHLSLQENGRLPVELVVDCTGFRGLLIQQTLGEPFESYGKHLLCDRALAVQLPHAEPTQLEPCTRSTALGAGWSWRVPLYSRVGTGYVFSSAFRSDEEAIEEFLTFLRGRGERAEGAEPRAIAMRVGRSRRSWVKNCVAVGLSGGFVEPLESTAIFMIEKAARWICKHFPYRGIDESAAGRFNALMQELYEEIRDFIMLHYLTSNRSEPFWQAARSDVAVPDSLAQKLETWRHKLPGPEDLKSSYLFNFWSYVFVLHARGYFEQVPPPEDAAVTLADWQAFSWEMAQTRQAMLAHLVGHYDLVTAMRERPLAETGQRIPAEAAVPFSLPADPMQASVPLP